MVLPVDNPGAPFRREIGHFFALKSLMCLPTLGFPHWASGGTKYSSLPTLGFPHWAYQIFQERLQNKNAFLKPQNARPSLQEPRRPSPSSSSPSQAFAMRPPGISPPLAAPVDQSNSGSRSGRWGPANPLSQNKGERDRTWKMAVFKPGKRRRAPAPCIL